MCRLSGTLGALTSWNPLCQNRPVQRLLYHCFTIMWLPYLFSPWSRVLLEKLTGFKLVKKLPAFYETRRFVAAFTSACLLSLSWASPIQSIPPHPTSWTAILILSSHLRLGLQVVSFLQASPPKPCISLSSLSYALHHYVPCGGIFWMIFRTFLWNPWQWFQVLICPLWITSSELPGYTARSTNAWNTTFHWLRFFHQ